MAAPSKSGKRSATSTSKREAARDDRARRKAEKKAAEQIAERVTKATEICDLYRTGIYTIESCCATAGISDNTLREWCARHSEISELYKKAADEHSRARLSGPLREKALNSYERLLVGYEYEEQQTIGEPVQKPDGTTGVRVKEIRKTKKYVPPSPAMVAMGMRNLHGFKDRLDLVHGGTVDVRQVATIGGIDVEF